MGYQWTFNGLNVGSNTNSYTRSNCQLSDNNGRVQVWVSNGVGVVLSSPATLKVNPNGPQVRKLYYVAPNGSSGNDGQSTNSPWTLDWSIAHAGTSNDIILMDGVYDRSSLGQVRIYDVNNLTFRAQNKWKAVIANSSYRGIEIYNSPYIVLDGLCVSNSYDDGIKLMGDHDTVRNCWVVNNGTNGDVGQNGIAANGGTDNYMLLEYNLIEWNGAWVGARAGHGHGIYVNGPGQVVRGNVVRYNGGYGIQFYSSSMPVLQHGCLIYNNLTYGHANHWGMTVYGGDDPDGSSSGTNYVFGNTICDGIDLNYGTVDITNNIILPSPQSPNPIHTWGGAYAPTVRSDYNLSSTALTPAGAHDVLSGTANFVNSANGLYWLKATSAARSHALPAVCGANDFFGVAQSSVSDIGAFQYNAAYTNDRRQLDPSPPTGADYWSALP